MAERRYRLVVAGELSAPVEHAFEGMRLERDGRNTALIGPVRDQASLQGLLQRVSDLGLTLISANAIVDVAPERDDSVHGSEGPVTARSNSRD